MTIIEDIYLYNFYLNLIKIVYNQKGICNFNFYLMFEIHQMNL